MKKKKVNSPKQHRLNICFFKYFLSRLLVSTFKSILSIFQNFEYFLAVMDYILEIYPAKFYKYLTKDKLNVNF
jgi:hypothetical protein